MTDKSRARRCSAQQRPPLCRTATIENDEVMKAYWRHLAVSWNEIAVESEFAASFEEKASAKVPSAVKDHAGSK